MATMTALPSSRPRPELDEATLRIVSRLARRAASRWGLSVFDREDLEQDLLVDVLRRASKFDPDRGASLGTFAYRIAENRLSSIRRPGIVVAEPSSGEPSVSAGDDRDLAIDLAGFVQALPARLRTLCEHLETSSVSESARRLGVSRATVRRDVKRLRELLNGAGLAIYLRRRRP